MDPHSTRANAPGIEVPAAVRDAWLRFHEEGWCRGVDAVFVFYEDGMEAWCVVEDERSYRRFEELVEPLRTAHRIALYPTRPGPGPKTTFDQEPPPSLWNNAELRAYFQDPLARLGGGSGMTARTAPEYPSEAVISLRQRLLLYAEQVLDWGGSMERYARELEPLASFAYAGRAPAEARRQAGMICLQHARELDKLAQKLADNLARAFPRTARRSRAAATGRDAARTRTPLEAAVELRRAAEGAAGKVRRFVHPRDHTVNLQNLKEPSLLDQLAAVRRAVSDYTRAAAQPVRR